MDPLKKISVSPIPNVSNPKNRDIRQNGFQDTLKSLISQVDRQIKEANQKTADFAVGKKYDLHEIMIASEKANLSFKFLLQVRNKLLDAYQEIMRMQF